MISKKVGRKIIHFCQLVKSINGWASPLNATTKFIRIEAGCFSSQRNIDPISACIFELPLISHAFLNLGRINAFLVKDFEHIYFALIAEEWVV